ncbi:MAG: hypothetical protein QF492_07680 [Candidatus Krumholzibacteria bacterium]|nr:hypothetical protein [Candidatus Krumholzibacteria bacterium]MDP6669768.1 hypothetical protein [Candidatus Krumholzibacteria bacterium]MDP6796748.1 hypothetical protein [Candidatus Krumholzibacteria bacterium]MDP7021698.1 hypothetical protein [Candidatus Krumholzibacteria bacterium]
MPPLQEGSQAGDLPLGMVEKARECLDRLGQIQIEKDDAAFYCRHPR